MEFATVILANAYVCLPLTTVVTFWVFSVVRREQGPVIYYINLLSSNLIQFIVLILGIQQHATLICAIIYIVVLMVSLYFRMSIAIERCFVITRPQSNWIRQTGRSMLVSVLVWILCIITVSLSAVFIEIIPLLVFGLLPAPLFIFFSAWTFKALPAATSVPTDEKRRIVGTLVLLFINYFLMILPAIISLIATTVVAFYRVTIVSMWVTFILFLLSPYADLILFFFMRKGAIDKLLSCLCCCITENTAADGAGHQQLHELRLQRERESEKANQTV